MASTRPGTRTLASVDPQEYSTSAVMPWFLRWLRVAVTSSVAMRFALQVLDGLDVRVFGDCDDPARGLRCGFAIGKFGDFDYVGFVFADPVDAGEANVEGAAFDVVRDFLGAQEQTLEFGVVYNRCVGPVAGVDAVTGLGK